MRPICSAENPVSSSRRLFHRRSRPCLSTRQYAPGIRSSQPRSRSDTAGRTTSPPLPPSPACLLSLTLIQFILVNKPRQNPNRPQHHIARKEHSRKRPTSQNRTDDQLMQNEERRVGKERRCKSGAERRTEKQMGAKTRRASQ